MAESALTTFFESLFTPPNYLESFSEPTSKIEIYHFTAPEKPPTKIPLKVYPFQTLYDLKVLIYQHFGKQIWAHPMFQSICIPFGDEETELAQSYTALDYTYTKAESTDPKDVLLLEDPFTRVWGPDVDTQFVTETGKRNLSFAFRQRMTLEDFFTSESKLLHLFFYKDVVEGMNPELRVSEREWYGRIAPYFPEVPLNQRTTSVPEAQQKRITVFNAYVETSMESLAKLDESLKTSRQTLLPITLTGVKLLRLRWSETKSKGGPSLETLFYTANATHERPFLRILPVSAPPITKLKMASTLKIPDVPDPRLLLTWKEERNPKPDSETLIAKVMIREREGSEEASQPALYGTLRMFADSERSADFVMLPPKQLRVLDPRSDLRDLGPLLAKGFAGLPLEGLLPEIGEASVVASIRLAKQSKPVTSETLRSRLTLFGTLFQEIPPLPGDNPLLMLRYKAVSDFAREDRQFTFLTQYASRVLLKGEAPAAKLVSALVEEFQLSSEEAESKAASWLQNRNQIQLAVPETKDYIMTFNPGVDLAIFSQQSYYIIHLYRVESRLMLDRILTAVTLLLSGKETTFPKTEAAKTAAAELTRLSTAVTVVPPGSDPAVKAQAEAALAPPIVIKAEEEEEEEAEFGEANLGDYGALMMGRVAEGEEEEEEAERLSEGVLGEVEKADIAEIVAENARAVAEATAQSLSVAPPPLAPAPEIPRSEESEEEAPTSGKAKQSYQGWVKSQLQIADQRLFQYKTDIAGRKIKKYVTMCQATESRQPFVLNQDQFDLMRETYREDLEKGEIDFIVYPLERGEALPDEAEEVYTLLRYGTNPLRQNYYLCCQFFCTKDYLMVREKDFYSTTDREGNPKTGESSPGAKDKGSCPFCHGTEIKVLKSPRPNETVIQRRTKKGDTKRHLYISFLKGTTQHPEEFHLPCCFTEDTVLYSTDPRFAKLRSAEEEEEAEEAEEVKSTAGIPITSYQTTLYRAHKKYIVGPEKEYLKMGELEGPQIGLLPTSVNAYFNQDPKQIVSRLTSKMELLPNAACFLRVAVENRSPYRFESFLAAIAPYLEYRNSAAAVKARILEVVVPRVFVTLNYGNLVLEFYDPNDPEPKTGDVLKLWAQEQLGVTLTSKNKDALLRVWKSYTRFVKSLSEPTLKEYRQFAQVLALPGLLSPRGLVLIVLEVDEDNHLRVRCPPFGYNEDRYATSDVGFILHRSSGVWEPIFYSWNRAAGPKTPEEHEGILKFQESLEASWPAIVKQRVAEFRRHCAGPGRGAYTSSESIDPKSLIPISRAVRAGFVPNGVVRDSYNHVAAVTYPIRYEGKLAYAALPVIDDEYTTTPYKLYMDWDDFKPAPLDLLVAFYKTNFDDLFSLYPGYRPAKRVKNSEGAYVALQLANGLFVPASNPLHEIEIQGLRLHSSPFDEPPWKRNREIYFGTPTTQQDSEDKKREAYDREFEEIFEHLRLTFSTWLSGVSKKETRDKIRSILYDRKIPLFEKRKRLDILYGPTIREWMDDGVRSEKAGPSLLRVDCRLRSDQLTCSGKCVWREERGSSPGKCLLHVPKSEGRDVDGIEILKDRLIEELLRFPQRQQELLENKVPTLVAIQEKILIGDQYVLPEGSVAWHDLLRLDWIESTKESKKYFEEMSKQEEAPRKEPSTNLLIGKALPSILQEEFGATDPKTASLYLIRAPTTASLSALFVPLGLTLGEVDIEEDATELDEPAIQRLAAETKRPIVSFNLTGDFLMAVSAKPSTRQKIANPYIFVFTEDGPGILSASKARFEEIPVAKLPKTLQELIRTASVVKVKN